LPYEKIQNARRLLLFRELCWVTYTILTEEHIQDQFRDHHFSVDIASRQWITVSGSVTAVECQSGTHSLSVEASRFTKINKGLFLVGRVA
jgi:hypothetical protein